MGAFKGKGYSSVCNRERSEAVGSMSSGLGCRVSNLSLASRVTSGVLHFIFVPQCPPSGKWEEKQYF